MLTLQTNKEIRINKGDTGMAPLFVNIGDNLRPIGYEFNIPIDINIVCDSTHYFLKFLHYNDGVMANVDEQTLYLKNMNSDPDNPTVIFYEDAWREKVLVSGSYHIWSDNNVWMWDNGDPDIEEEINIEEYGIIFPKYGVLPADINIYIEFELIDNDSEIMFQMWPILEIPEVPTLKKIILPKENKVTTYLYDEIITMEHINTVNSYGEILLKFKPEDTEQLERGKYLYNIKSNLFNKYSNEYEIKTILNRTPFYIIDDNFSQRIW